MKGGIRDVITVRGLPVPERALGEEKYAYRVEPGEGEASITVSVEKEGLKVERRMTIFRGSTRLQVLCKNYNMSDKPAEICARIHPYFSVGGEAPNTDCLIRPQGNVLIKRPLAHEKAYFAAEDGWWAAIDPDNKEAVVMTYDPAEVGRLFTWYRAPNAYTLEYMGRWQEVKPGDYAQVKGDYWIITQPDELEAIRTAASPLQDEQKENLIKNLTLIYKHLTDVLSLKADTFCLEDWAALSIGAQEIVYEEIAPIPPPLEVRLFRNRERDEEIKVEVSLLAEDGSEKGELEKTLRFAKGRTARTVPKDLGLGTGEIADGIYLLRLVTAQDTYLFPQKFLLAGHLRREIADFSARIRDKLLPDRVPPLSSKELKEAALLGLRRIDLEFRLAKIASLLAPPDYAGYLKMGPDSPAPDTIAPAWTLFRETEALADEIIRGKVPEKTPENYWGALVRPRDSETIWESGRDYTSVGVYFAGIPVATIFPHIFATEEKAAQDFGEYVKSAKEANIPYTEGKTKEGLPYVLFEDPIYLNGALLKGNKIFDIFAPTKNVIFKLFQKVIDTDGIAAADVQEMVAGLDLPVVVENLKQILDFDYQNPLICLEDDAGEFVEKIAEKLRARFGGQIVIGEPAEPLEQKNILGLLISKPGEKMLEGKGLLGFVTSESNNAVVVGGDDRLALNEAAEMLIALVEVLKDRKMLIGDLHMHTTHSDGDMPPTYVALSTLRNYMDFMALTDHNTISGLAEIYDLQKQGHLKYIIITGEEVTLPDAHILGLGITDLVSAVVEGNPISPAEAVQMIHKKGGVAILAHPGYPDSDWTRDAIQNWNPSKVDGFSAPPYSDMYLKAYREWKLKERLPLIISETDSHSGLFSWPDRTIVFVKEESPEGVIKAIKEGYCLGYCGGRLYGSDKLIRVFSALLAEKEYLEQEHLRRLVERVRSLY